MFNELNKLGATSNHGTGLLVGLLVTLLVLAAIIVSCAIRSKASSTKAQATASHDFMSTADIVGTNDIATRARLITTASAEAPSAAFQADTGSAVAASMLAKSPESSLWSTATGITNQQVETIHSQNLQVIPSSDVTSSMATGHVDVDLSARPQEVMHAGELQNVRAGPLWPLVFKARRDSLRDSTSQSLSSQQDVVLGPPGSEARSIEVTRTTNASINASSAANTVTMQTLVTGWGGSGGWGGSLANAGGSSVAAFLSSAGGSAAAGLLAGAGGSNASALLAGATGSNVGYLMSAGGSNAAYLSSILAGSDSPAFGETEGSTATTIVSGNGVMPSVAEDGPVARQVSTWGSLLGPAAGRGSNSTAWLHRLGSSGAQPHVALSLPQPAAAPPAFSLQGALTQMWDELANDSSSNHSSRATTSLVDAALHSLHSSGGAITRAHTAEANVSEVYSSHSRRRGPAVMELEEFQGFDEPRPEPQLRHASQHTGSLIPWQAGSADVASNSASNVSGVTTAAAAAVLTPAVAGPVAQCLVSNHSPAAGSGGGTADAPLGDTSSDASRGVSHASSDVSQLSNGPDFNSPDFTFPQPTSGPLSGQPDSSNISGRTSRQSDNEALERSLGQGFPGAFAPLHYLPALQLRHSTPGSGFGMSRCPLNGSSSPSPQLSCASMLTADQFSADTPWSTDEIMLYGLDGNLSGLRTGEAGMQSRHMRQAICGGSWRLHRSASLDTGLQNVGEDTMFGADPGNDDSAGAANCPQLHLSHLSMDGRGQPAAGGSGGASAPTQAGTSWARSARTRELHSASRHIHSILQDVIVTKLLGQGEHGKVYQGTWADQLVAVKVVEHEMDSHLTNAASTAHELRPEFKKSLEGLVGFSANHPNIVDTYKIVTQLLRSNTPAFVVSKNMNPAAGMLWETTTMNVITPPAPTLRATSSNFAASTSHQGACARRLRQRAPLVSSSNRAAAPKREDSMPVGNRLSSRQMSGTSPGSDLVGSPEGGSCIVASNSAAAAATSTDAASVDVETAAGRVSLAGGGMLPTVLAQATGGSTMATFAETGAPHAQVDSLDCSNGTTSMAGAGREKAQSADLLALVRAVKVRQQEPAVVAAEVTTLSPAFREVPSQATASNPPMNQAVQAQLSDQAAQWLMAAQEQQGLIRCLQVADDAGCPGVGRPPMWHQQEALGSNLGHVPPEQLDAEMARQQDVTSSSTAPLADASSFDGSRSGGTAYSNCSTACYQRRCQNRPYASFVLSSLPSHFPQDLDSVRSAITSSDVYLPHCNTLQAICSGSAGDDSSRVACATAAQQEPTESSPTKPAPTSVSSDALMSPEPAPSITHVSPSTVEHGAGATLQPWCRAGAHASSPVTAGSAVLAGAATTQVAPDLHKERHDGRRSLDAQVAGLPSSALSYDTPEAQAYTAVASMCDRRQAGQPCLALFEDSSGKRVTGTSETLSPSHDQHSPFSGRSGMCSRGPSSVGGPSRRSMSPGQGYAILPGYTAITEGDNDSGSGLSAAFNAFITHSITSRSILGVGGGRSRVPSFLQQTPGRGGGGALVSGQLVGWQSQARGKQQQGRRVWQTLIIQEYCSQGSLQAALMAGRFHHLDPASGRLTISLAALVETATEIAMAMTYLHSKRLLHGDLKTLNILLQKSDSLAKGFAAKVADFGLARLLAKGEEELMVSKFGTVTHMPPETISDNVVVLASDVYSFGIILWELFCADKPFAKYTSFQVLTAVAQNDERPNFPHYCPEDYAALAAACLARDHHARPAFADVVESLRKIREALSSEDLVV